MTKLEILSSQSAIMPHTDSYEQLKTFMIVIEPQDHAGSNKDWEGSINKVTKLMKQSMVAQEKVLLKKLSRQQVDIAELMRTVRQNDMKMTNGLSEVVNSVDSQVKTAIDGVRQNQKKMKKMEERQEKMMEMLKHLI